MNDFLYQLTDLGRERAKRYWSHCTYFGAAPVSLEDYVESVKAQSLADAADHGRTPAARPSAISCSARGCSTGSDRR